MKSVNYRFFVRIYGDNSIKGIRVKTKDLLIVYSQKNGFEKCYTESFETATFIEYNDGKYKISIQHMQSEIKEHIISNYAQNIKIYNDINEVWEIDNFALLCKILDFSKYAKFDFGKSITTNPNKEILVIENGVTMIRKISEYKENFYSFGYWKKNNLEVLDSRSGYFEMKLLKK